MPIISKPQKLSIVEVWQHGKVIFTGNCFEVREHFGITQQQFGRMRNVGNYVLNGRVPHPETLYAIKVGEETKIIQVNYNTGYSQEELDAETERRKHETKEERRLRRRIQRDIARERFYNE